MITASREGLFLRVVAVLVLGLGLGALASMAAPATAATRAQEPQQQGRPRFSFAVLTDVRYADRAPAGDRDYRAGLDRLRDSIRYLNRQKLQFAVQLGDLIEDDGDDLQTVLRHWRRLHLDGVSDSRSHSVIGGRDLSHIEGHEARQALVHELRIPREFYHFAGDGWHFVFLDGTSLENNGEQHHDIRVRQQREFLRRALQDATNSGCRAVVFCHFPVLAAAASPEALAKGHREILATLESWPCSFAWIAGNHLQGGYALHNGIHHLTLRGIASSPKEGTFAIVDAHDDRLEVRGHGRQESRSLVALDRRPKALASVRMQPVPDSKDPFAFPRLRVEEGSAMGLVVRDGQPFLLAAPKGRHSLGVPRTLSSNAGRLHMETSGSGVLVVPGRIGTVNLELGVQHHDGRVVTAPLRVRILPRGLPRVLTVHGSHQITVRQGEEFRVRASPHSSVLGWRAKDSGLQIVSTHPISAERRRADKNLEDLLARGYGDVHGVTVRALQPGIHGLLWMAGKKGARGQPAEIPVLVCPVARVGTVTVEMLSAWAYDDFQSLPQGLLAGVTLRIENPSTRRHRVRVVELVQSLVPPAAGKEPVKAPPPRHVKMARELSVPPQDSREFSLRLPPTAGEAWHERQILVTVVLADTEGKQVSIASWPLKVGTVH